MKNIWATLLVIAGCTSDPVTHKVPDCSVGIDATTVDAFVQSDARSTERVTYAVTFERQDGVVPDECGYDQDAFVNRLTLEGGTARWYADESPQTAASATVVRSTDGWATATAPHAANFGDLVYVLGPCSTTLRPDGSWSCSMLRWELVSGVRRCGNLYNVNGQEVQ